MTARESVHTQRWKIISLPSFSSILDTRSLMVVSESAIIYTAIQHNPVIKVLLWTTILNQEEARSAYVAVVPHISSMRESALALVARHAHANPQWNLLT